MAQLTVPVGEAKKGETAPRRAVAQKSEALTKPLFTSATTLPDFIKESVKRNGNLKCMGWRELMEIHSETKKVKKIVDGEEKEVDKNWTFYEYSSYKYQTYNEVLSTIELYSRGLVHIGLKPGQQDKLHVYASTSHKWLKTFLAASFQNIPIVTAYDTLGQSGLIHSLVLTESNAIFTDNALLSTLLEPVQKSKHIRYIIHSEDINADDKRDGGKIYKEAADAKQKISKVRPDIKFYSYDEVVALGESKSDVVDQAVKPTDVCCIMYTSGSTGDPKGVVITQANIIAGIAGPSSIAGRDLVKQGDRIIAFLPLAHIFEMVFELICFWWGGCIGYANVKTLTEASCKNCKPDLIEFQPNIMVGVAAVWESVRKGILAKIKQLPGVVQKIFWLAFKLKATMQSYRIPGGSIFDIIFKRVKSATGGELRFMLNGGSPISKDTQVFISTLIAPMLIGYGLTETCANATVLDYNNFEYGVAGTIVGSVTCKLVDVEDAGYFAKNNQGEIFLSGAPITGEYFRNEEETKKAFTEDGWFMTGDIGEWTPSGALKIIDRKKNLVKTANGEYIALEKLESTYRSNSLVLNICVYADSSKVKPIAMIIPNEAHLKSLLIDSKVTTETELKSKELSDFYTDKKVVNLVLKDLLSTGKAQGLRGIELLQNVVLIDDEWTPQNGFVTSAQKLQRKKILNAYQSKVDAAYAS